MKSDLENLIKQAFKEWKSKNLNLTGSHPDEEDIVSFVEGKLPNSRKEEVKQHIIHCQDCANLLAILLALPTEEYEPSPVLVSKVKEALGVIKIPQTEIFLKVKEKAFELLRASGDILIGQELIPAAVLRSRNLDELKDEVVMLKDFERLRLKIRIENKLKKYFNVNIELTDKLSKSANRDLRISLFKEEVELESYLNDSGSVTFEHIPLGSYKVIVSDLEKVIASVFIEVKV